jgi:hypothetical protein
MIICKRTESKIVDMIKVNRHAKDAPIKSIRYNNDKSESLKGKLSKDMTCCYVNNVEDNVFFDSQSDVQLTDLHWFKDQIVLKMKEVHLPNHSSGPGFLCLTAKPFDNKLTLLHTNDSEFQIVI